MDPASMTAALQGVRVLDFSQQVSGPFASMILGDLGADVIKVEPPEGEAMRRTGETFYDGEAVYFLSVNRNKRGIVLDLAQESGRATARALASQVDIVMENFRPGVAERLGIGYDDLKADNPGLIYCSISAFGRTGPDASRPGMDPVVQAMSGIMQLTGTAASGPLKTGLPFADVITPMLATIGMCAALQHRARTGAGQRIDLAMLDCALFGIAPREQYYFATGDTPARIGNAHYEIVPYNTYETADGRHLMLIAHSDKHWQLLARATGNADLADDPALAVKAGRVAQRARIDAALARSLAAQPLAHWNRVLAAGGVMFAPVATFPEVFESERIGREMVSTLERPGAGPFRVLNNPLHFSASPTVQRHVPPRLGEHTAEVLAEFGLTPPGAGA